ncbi:MAG: ABC transporter permease [Candidatus Krumholzibacteriota bacterium]|nr:ABC transporter permease [Candidatus Krumholzibacteriota bacterium]
MRNVLNILWNDLKRRSKSPLAVILIMLIPIVLTLIVGLVFGRSGGVSMPRVKMLVVDNDAGLLGNLLRQSLQHDSLAVLLEVEVVEGERGRELMEKGKASALLEIPEGFTEDFLNRRPAELRILKNPSETFKPVIAEEVVNTLATILNGGGSIFSRSIAQARVMFDAGGWPSGSEVTGLLDGARGGIALVRDYISDPLITLKEETVVPADEKESTGEANIFSYVLPGSMMIGLLFISELVLRDIVREKQAGTLYRILAAPLEASQVVAGKILSTFAVTLISCLVLLLISAVGFRMDLGRPVPLAVHLLGTIFMCTGVITLCYGFIDNERAADAVMSILIILMALFGGSMVPFEQLGSGLQKVGRFSPVYWASDGFKKIFMTGAGLGELRAHLTVLYGVALATVFPGALLLDRRVRKGR